MALFLFTKSIIEGKPIQIFNRGQMIRDFTYIDDVVESILRIIFKPPCSNNSFNTDSPDSSCSWAPHRIFNVGNSCPTPLMDYISAIEQNLGMCAKKEFLAMQPGDVQVTSSDTSLLQNWVNFKPSTSIQQGVKKFVSWYLEYYVR